MRKRRGISTKALVALLALVLVIGCSLGGTLAWFADETNAVTNTFTVGNIKITLTEEHMNEQGYTYKIFPGATIAKNPTVTVKANSEDCWLFVKLTEGNWCNQVTYTPADGWTELQGEDGVYYQEVTASNIDQPFGVLKGDTLTVNEDLTKADIEQMKNQGNPTLTITAYAVQKEGVDTPEAAWAIANPTNP